MARVPANSPRMKSAQMRTQKRREERAGLGEAQEQLGKENKIRAIVGKPAQPVRYINDASAVGLTNEALRKRKAALR